jgi:hypothetical protein
MATNSTIGQVDRLLDDVQLTRVDLHGDVQSVRANVLRLRHIAYEVYQEMMEIEQDLAGPDDHSPGGPLFQQVADVRSSRAVRKARTWDGRFRRKSDSRDDDRHLEVAA